MVVMKMKSNKLILTSKKDYLSKTITWTTIITESHEFKLRLLNLCTDICFIFHIRFNWFLNSVNFDFYTISHL